MTTDLQYLAYTALLTASLWIVYIAAQGDDQRVARP
jgi:hypothetical protein